MSVRSNTANFSLAKEKVSYTTQDGIKKKIVSIQNDRQSVKSFENFLDPNLPICVIGCEGKVGTGKSTLMSLIALHLDNKIPANELFGGVATSFSATPGCSVLNKRLVFNGVQIVLMDFEGQGGIQDSSRKMEDSEYEQYLNKLMCLSFVIPSVLIVVSHQRIQKDDLDNMKYLESIHRRMTIQKINLPAFKWFIREGYQLNPQTLAETNVVLRKNSPCILENTHLTWIPQIDQDTLNFSKRLKFQVIEDLLIQATSNPQKLPTKSKFLKIFEDTFSFINNDDFEVAYGQKLAYYRVWEEWEQIEGPRFVQTEKQLALHCEMVNDDGNQFEIGYKILIQPIFEDIQQRLQIEGISSYNVFHELQNDMKNKFNLQKAKDTYLKEKKQKQDTQNERNEHEQKVKKLQTERDLIQKDNQNNIQIIQDQEKRIQDLQDQFKKKSGNVFKKIVKEINRTVKKVF